MSIDQIPKPQPTPENPEDMLYSDRLGFVLDEPSDDDDIPLVPILRSDKSVDFGWMRIGTLNGKVVFQKNGAQKAPSEERLRQAAEQWEAMQTLRTPEVLPTQTQQDLGLEAVKIAHDDNDDCLTPEQSRQLRAEIAAESAASPLDRFAYPDQRLLNSFATYALRKREAQLANDGPFSSDCTQRMGAALKEMSKEARDAARNVAQKMYGDSNVAF